MANPAQQAILDRVNNRLGGNQDDEKQSSLTDRQRELLATAQARLGSPAASKDDGSDFVAGVAGGVDSFQGTLYGLAGLAGDGLERTVGVGEGLRDWGFQGYQENMAEVDDEFREAYTWDGATDSVGNFVDAGQYYVGRVIPDAAAAVVSGGVGAAIAKKAVSEGAEAVIKNRVKNILGDAIGDKVTKAGVGSLTGVTTQSIAQSTGGIYGQAGEQAIAEGGSLEDVNLGRVVTGGVAAGLVETVADVATLGLAGFGVGRNLLNLGNTGGLARRVATKGATGAAVESVTEGVQTGIEDMGAGASFGEANFMDPTSMMAGAFGGGAVSGVGGARKPTNQGTSFAAEEAVRQAEEEVALQQQQQSDVEAEGLARQQEITEQSRARREAAQTFTPRAEYAKARQAEITAQLEQDVVNPATEIGQAFEVHLNEQGIFDPADVVKESKAYLKGVQKENDSSTQITQEYLDALDAHVDTVAQAKEFVAQNPDVMDADAETFATAAAQNPEVFNVISGMRTAAVQAAVTAAVGDAATTGTVDATGAADATVTPDVVVEAPAKLTKKEQLGEMAREQLGDTWEQDNPELSQLYSDGKGIYSRGKGKKSRFETMVAKLAAERTPAAVEPTPASPGIVVDANPTPLVDAPPVAPVVAEAQVAPVVAEAQVAPTVEPVQQAPTTEATQTTDAESVDAPPIIEGVEAIAIDYATEKLGPNWREENPQLVAVLEGKNYAGFQLNVDRVAESRPAPTETTAVEPVQTPEPTTVAPTEAATAVGNLFSQPLPDTVKLSPSEQKVFDVLNQAFQNNEQDDVIASDGSLNPQRIADRAGLKSRQAAQTAITRLKAKIAKQYGLDQTQIKQQLADTRIKNVEAFDVNAPDQVFDVAALGDSSGTLASANQGARDGMAAEDAAFIDDMQETPNRIQSDTEKASIQAEIDADIRADRAYTPAQETWDNGFESDVENESSRVPFDSMDAGSRFEFLHYFTEYQRGNFGLDELGQYYDDIRADYKKDTQNAELETTDPVGQIESKPDPQETGPTDSEVRAEGSPAVEGQTQENADPDNEQLTSEQFKARSANVPVVTKKKRRVVVPPKNPEEAPGAKRQGKDSELNTVDAVAEKIGGEVVYQKGEVALVRGYSAQTGAPVYVAAKGSAFTTLDVESYTGSEFTSEQLADLVRAKKEAEVEAQKVHAETPFVTFDNGLAFSESMTPEMQAVVREWQNLLGIDVDVYVTTLEDAKANKLNFTGPQRAVGSGTLDSNERGSTRKLSDGSHYIVYDAQASKVGTLETIAHEMGHVHQKVVFDKASPEMQQDLRAEHRKWLESQKGATAKDLVESLRARQTGKTTDVPTDLPADKVTPYWKSFNEWYADQVSRWATTQDAPLTAVEKFFSRLGKSMRSFYDQLANKKYLPSDAFVQYLDRVKNANLRDPINDSAEFSSNDMAGSMQSSPESQARTSRFGEWARGHFGATGKQFVDDVSEVARQGTQSLKFLHQYVRDVKGRMPAAGDMYQAIKEADKTRHDIRRQVEAIAVRARELTPERLAVLNDFLSKSTFYQKWGYDPQFTDGKGVKRDIKTDPIMAASYNRLSPEERSLVREIFQHGENMRMRKQAMAKLLGVDKSFFSAAALEGPYAPLKRFGDYAGVLKSQALVDAEEENAVTSTLALRKKIDTMKSQQEHYVVSFFDTMGAAKKFTDEHRGTYATAVPSQRTDDLMADRVTNEEAFQKILGSLGASDSNLIDPKSKKAFADMIRELYFDSVDERDARMSGSKRKNRAGYEKNMVRSFLSHAKAEAGMISTMEHGADINLALAEAMKQSNTDPENLKPVYNMLVAHYKDTLTYQDTAFQRVSDRIAALNSVYMLTSSIGYHVTNATQPAMVTVPRLAGDFGDYAGAWGKLTRGYKVAIGVARMTSKFETEIDLNKVPPQYRALLEDLQLRNLLDVGMEEDLSSFDRFNTGYESLNVAGDKLGMVTHKLYQAARIVEAHNRISTAVAAYDMARDKPHVAKRQGMTPTEYAISVVEDTQGNFSRMDAPLAIKALPKLTTQYRKYQLMMAWAYANATKQTFKGESPEMRAMGRRTLGYMLAHAGLFAGATGMPLVSTLAPYVLAFISGEDEPQDLDRWIMTNVPGKAGEVLAKGAFNFIGLDMSAKLSQGKIFDPFPYLDYDVSEDGVKDLVFNLAAGPSGTTMINFTRSAEYFGRGDVLKGIEYMVPKGIRSATESYRMATEGISFKNGDIVVDPRDIDVPSLLINALGLPSSEINKVKWTRSQQYELEQYFSEETGRMRREYIDAKSDRDNGAMRELRTEWKDLQQQKKRVRPFFGRDVKTLRPQPVTSLMKAPYQQSAREKRAQRRFQ